MTRQQALQTLGLSSNASKSQIKKAFHNKAFQYHPDKNPDGNTQQKFVEVVEAYEILNGDKKPKTHFTKSNSYRTKPHHSENTHFHFRNKNHVHRNYTEHISREEFEERYQRAKQRYEEYFNKKSQKIYNENFKEYMNGSKRKFAKIMAAIGLLLILLFSLDHYLLPQRFYKIDLENTHFDFEYEQGSDVYYSFQFLNQSVFVNTKYLKKLYKKKAETLVATTYIFKDVLRVINVSPHGQKVENIAQLNSSLHYHFMLVMLLLFIPTLTFWVERPTFNFVFFGVYYNIFVFPIFIAFLLLNDLRILRIFESL
jgi:curved DNA-binding protein CbpA